MTRALAADGQPAPAPPPGLAVTAPPPGRTEGVTLIALLGGTLAIYAGVLFAGFVWDDTAVVLPVASRPVGVTLREAWARGVSVEGVPLGYYRPLVDLSYALDGWLWGRRPLGFHLTNLLLYALCVGLAFRLARRLAGPGVGATAAAIAFAAHPVHVESVAWVQGRGDLLAFAGVAGAILAFLRSFEAGRAWAWRWAAGFATLGAALAKEWALVAPALAGAAWWLVVRRHPAPPPWERRAGARVPREFGAAMAPLAVALAVYAALRLASAVAGASDTAVAHLPMSQRWLILAPTFSRYLGLLLWPHPLSAYHPVPVPAGAGDARVVGGAILAAAILGAALWATPRAPRMALAVWWFLIALVPVLPVLPLKGFHMAERYLFLPSFGFALAAGLLAERAWGCARTRRARWALAACGAAVALAWGAAASARVPDWVHPIDFYRALLRTAPDFALAHANLGALLVADGSVEEGLRHLERAVVLQPDLPEAHSNLGLAYGERGDAVAALGALETALRLRPRDPRILGDAARTLARLGRSAEALPLLRRLEGLQPPSPDVARRLAEAYAALGDRDRSAHYASLADRLSGSPTGSQAAPPPRHPTPGHGD